MSGLIRKAQTVSVQVPDHAELAIDISWRNRRPGEPDEFIRASLPASLAWNPRELQKAFLQLMQQLGQIRGWGPPPA